MSGGRDIRTYRRHIKSNRQLEVLNLAHDKICDANVDGINDEYSILIDFRLLAFINNKITTLNNLYLDL